MIIIISFDNVVISYFVLLAPVSFKKPFPSVRDMKVRFVTQTTFPFFFALCYTFEHQIFAESFNLHLVLNPVDDS